MRLPKSGKAVVLNAPPGALKQLGLDPPPNGLVVATRAGKDADFVVAFLPDLRAVDALAPKAVASGKHDCMMWLCWPKKSGPVKTDITRDNLWEKMAALGMRGVANVSIDETWSGFRARPAET